MPRYETYVVAVVIALVILILGFLNLKVFQATDSSGKSSGYPNYIYLALFAFVIGLIVAWLYSRK